jgi:FKBP-type peptidyl-prolyl cis-trans isomerase
LWLYAYRVPSYNRNSRLRFFRNGTIRSRKWSAFSQGKRRKEEGVKTTPSGLQYKVVREGSGKTPKATDIVVVIYRGTLINGKEFDSSYKAGQPIEFPLNRVIPGWTEGVQLM